MTETLEDILPGPGERENVYGTTRSGKSSHLDWQMRGIQRYRPECMQLLLDTKPRFRAETTKQSFDPTGKRRTNASWLYRTWSKGPVLPNSVLVPLWDDHPFRGLWSRPGEIAIMQSGDMKDWLRMLELTMRFVKAHVSGRERRLTVDEVLDFYGRTTWSINSKNDVFYLAARAGGERNIGQSLGAQRIHGIPILIRDMTSINTLYHLDQSRDVKYLAENGIDNAVAPDGDFIFHQWRKQKGGTFKGPLVGTLDLPDWYLKQLADS